MKLKWGTPPEPNRGRRPDTRTQDEKIADELRKHPGDWAVYSENSNSSIAYQIGHGDRAAFRPAGTFEAVSRDNVGNRGTIWIRYTGEANGDE